MMKESQHIMMNSLPCVEGFAINQHLKMVRQKEVSDFYDLF